MASIVVFLLIHFQVLFHLVQGAHRDSYRNEFTSLLGVNAFGQVGNGFIGIFLCHSDFLTWMHKGTNKIINFVEF